jgi:hypothetical protein
MATPAKPPARSRPARPQSGAASPARVATGKGTHGVAKAGGAKAAPKADETAVISVARPRPLPRKSKPAARPMGPAASPVETEVISGGNNTPPPAPPGPGVSEALGRKAERLAQIRALAARTDRKPAPPATRAPRASERLRALEEAIAKIREAARIEQVIDRVAPVPAVATVTALAMPVREVPVEPEVVVAEAPAVAEVVEMEPEVVVMEPAVVLAEAPAEPEVVVAVTADAPAVSALIELEAGAEAPAVTVAAIIEPEVVAEATAAAPVVVDALAPDTVAAAQAVAAEPAVAVEQAWQEPLTGASWSALPIVPAPPPAEPGPVALSFEAALATADHPTPMAALLAPAHLPDPFEQILARRRTARSSPPPRTPELPVVHWLISKLRRWAGF